MFSRACLTEAVCVARIARTRMLGRDIVDWVTQQSFDPGGFSRSNSIDLAEATRTFSPACLAEAVGIACMPA